MSDFIDSADTVWILVCTAAIFLMLNGEGLFYGGSVQTKNRLSFEFSCYISNAIISLQWYLFGYTLSYSSNGSFIGDFNKVALRNFDLHPNDLAPTIPEGAFMLFECMFACAAGSIVYGAIGERVSLRRHCVFLFIWSFFAYNGPCHWIWGRGWLMKMGTLDFAGGIPVHIIAGFSSLAYAIFVGRKYTYPKLSNSEYMSNVSFGSALLWFGWLFFNGGSDYGINPRAVNAVVVTHLCAASSGLTWILCEMIANKNGKLSLNAFSNGVVAGLVLITPASGFVAPCFSLVFGTLGSILCRLSFKIKDYCKIDDPLNVFAVHGMGGVIGTLLTGVFAEKAISTEDIEGGWIDGNYVQIVYQFIGCCAGASWGFIVTLIILYLMNSVPALKFKLSRDEQYEGNDLSDIGETLVIQNENELLIS